MSGFKQTEIGLLPESWEIVKLKEVVNFTTGKLNANQAKNDGKYPFFTCSQETFWIDNYSFDTEAVLLSGNNARAIYSVKYFKGKFNAYQRTYVITIKDILQFSYIFLKYILSFNLERLRKFSIGTSTKYLTLGILENLEIVKPKVDEQENIAHILSQIQSAIETQEKIIQTTTELKKVLMQKLFTEGLRVEPQNETEIGKIPISWEVKKIKEICEIGTGGTPNTKVKEYYEPPEINWLKSGDINGLYITKINNMISTLGKENSNANTLYPPGSVMIAMSGRGKTRGTTAVLKVESTCSQSVAAIVPKKEINSEFLHFSLQYRYYEIRNITGHTDRSGLNLGLIGNIKVFVPSLKDQEEIAKILLGLERKIQIASMKQESLRKLFKSMLHHLMTGQIRVKDLKVS